MKIKISGVIIPNDYQDVYDWIGWEATSPKKIEQALADIENDEVIIEINSGGGSVFAGSEIYTHLKSSDKNITINIVGLAASAASVIAMAGDTVNMSPTAQMMIHNATSRQSGDYRNMDSASQMLKNTNQTLINAYKLKSGMNDNELKKMLDEETWFTAQQAKENKLIDGIMFEQEIDAVANLNDGLLPEEVLTKIKNKMLEDVTEINDSREEKTDEGFNILQAQAQLRLLKLKGDARI